MYQILGGAFFFFRKKTSEYSEIYREQLTSEHFLPYNYRSSTLSGISRNISRLLRQCGIDPSVKNFRSLTDSIGHQYIYKKSFLTDSIDPSA